MGCFDSQSLSHLTLNVYVRSYNREINSFSFKSEICVWVYVGCVYGVRVCVFPRFYLFNGLSRPIACKELNSKILLILKQDWRNMKIVKFSNFEFQISKFDNVINFWTLFITQREWLKKQIIWDVSTRRAPTTLRVYGLMIGQNKPYGPYAQKS